MGTHQGCENVEVSVMRDESRSLAHRLCLSENLTQDRGHCSANRQYKASSTVKTGLPRLSMYLDRQCDHVSGRGMANSAELYGLKNQSRVRADADITFFKSQSASAADLCYATGTGSDSKVFLQTVAVLLQSVRSPQI